VVKKTVHLVCVTYIIMNCIYFTQSPHLVCVIPIQSESVSHYNLPSAKICDLTLFPCIMLTPPEFTLHYKQLCLLNGVWVCEFNVAILFLFPPPLSWERVSSYLVTYSSCKLASNSYQQIYQGPKDLLPCSGIPYSFLMSSHWLN
jgi:hypothetical protein